MPHYLYVLLCSDNTYYTGVSKNPQERETAHNTKARVEYTWKRRPVKLAYTESHPDPSAARHRENQIKRWSHSKKKALVEGTLGQRDTTPPDPTAPDPSQLDKLANWRMPFGKYKGRRLVHLPEPYVVWFSRQGFPRGELGRLLQTLYEIKLNGLEHLITPFKRED